MAEPLLQATGLGHAHTGGAWLFRGLDVELLPGRITAVLGPNGRGKTTLLRLLAGLAPAREGVVVRSGAIAFVPQSHVPLPYTVLDMVLMGRAAHLGLFRTPGRADRDRAVGALDQVGLLRLADRPYDRLSGGERQLVLVARALAAESKVLLLDEPASALDLANQGVVLRLLRRLADRDGLAVALTTHHPDHAMAVADEVLLMAKPGRHALGPVNAVLTEGALTALYGLPVRRAILHLPGLPPVVFLPDYGIAG